MKRLPFFKFFPKDWLVSEKVSAMSGDAVKAYIYLLCQAWLSDPAGTLPTEDSQLSAMSRTHPKVWKRIRKEILPCFELIDQRLHCPKLVNLASIAFQTQFKLSSNGVKGNIRRWGKKTKIVDNQSENNRGAIQEGIAGRSHSQKAEGRKDFKDFAKTPIGVSPHPGEVKPKPDVHILIDHFHELRCKAFGEKAPFLEAGMAAKQFKALLNAGVGVPDIMRRIKNYFDSQDPFIKDHWPVAYFFKQFSRLKMGPLNGIARNGFQKELRDGPKIPSIEETAEMIRRDRQHESV